MAKQANGDDGGAVDWATLAARLDNSAERVSRLDGVVGCGLGLDGDIPVVHVFASRPLDRAALDALDDWFGTQYQLRGARGPAEGQ